MGRQLEQHGVPAPSYRPLLPAIDKLKELARTAPTQPGFVPVSKDAFAAAAQFGRESEAGQRGALNAMVDAVFNQPYGAPRELQELAGRALQRATSAEALRAVGAQLAEAINRYQPASAPKSSSWLPSGRG